MAPALKAADEYANTFIDEQVSILLPAFEALAPFGLGDREKGSAKKAPGVKGYKMLAIEAAATLKSVYSDDAPENEKRYVTACSQASKLKKALSSAAKTELEDPALKGRVETTVKKFSELLLDQFTIYRARTNSAYVKQVRERSQASERIEVNPTEYLQRAHTVLASIAAGEEFFSWLEVSCALAMVTGRRMAEIHLSAEFSEVVGETHLINYSGQLKGKNRRVFQDTLTDVTPYDLAQKNTGLPLREVVWQVPTLIPAALVVHGLQWLDKQGKRFPKDVDPVRVNGRWSKVLSEQCKQWELFPDMTFHKFRAGYFVCAVANAETAGTAGIDVQNYAEKILCDRDKLSIDAYKRFNLKDGSITKI